MLLSRASSLNERVSSIGSLTRTTDVNPEGGTATATKTNALPSTKTPGLNSPKQAASLMSPAATPKLKPNGGGKAGAKASATASPGLSGTAIGGIVAGVAIFALLVIAATWWILSRRRLRRRQGQTFVALQDVVLPFDPAIAPAPGDPEKRALATMEARAERVAFASRASPATVVSSVGATAHSSTELEAMFQGRLTRFPQTQMDSSAENRDVHLPHYSGSPPSADFEPASSEARPCGRDLKHEKSRRWMVWNR
jgi:hypothetical protein